MFVHFVENHVPYYPPGGHRACMWLHLRVGRQVPFRIFTSDLRVSSYVTDIRPIAKVRCKNSKGNLSSDTQMYIQARCPPGSRGNYTPNTRDVPKHISSTHRPHTHTPSVLSVRVCMQLTRPARTPALGAPSAPSACVRVELTHPGEHAQRIRRIQRD